MSRHDSVSLYTWMSLLTVMLAVAYLVARANSKEEARKNILYIAAINAIAALLHFINGFMPGVGLHGGLTVISLILWWFGGGGGRTKKRLKKLKEKFVGQRRTAPQTA